MKKSQIWRSAPPCNKTTKKNNFLLTNTAIKSYNPRINMNRQSALRKKRTRHIKGTLFGKMGFCTSWAVDVRGKGKEWIEVVERPLYLKNLPAQFVGKRIIHISDLHCSRTVSAKYLRNCIGRINRLKADIVLLTGDYTTCDYYGRFKKRIVDLMGGIQSNLGIYACLGNHDYGLGGVLGSKRQDALPRMVEGMQSQGITILRNESKAVQIGDRELWLVGLGDLWADDFEPQKAFAGIGKKEPVITLAHNPDSIDYLDGFSTRAVMSGHTHGIPTEWSNRRKKSASKRREYYSGMYHVGDKQLYVNRGLGRVGKMFFNTRPEITVFSLLQG